jgi:acyl carrier protein
MDDSVSAKVIAWLSDRSGVPAAQIRPDTNLREVIEDSLEYVELIMAYEEMVGDSPEDPGRMLLTVADLIDYARDHGWPLDK